MNRKEKFENKKVKNHKKTNIRRTIIISVMLIIAAIGILTVDYEANKMLGSNDNSLINYCINMFNKLRNMGRILIIKIN